MTTPQTFTCGECGGTFPFDPAQDEEAHQEALHLFGERGDAPDMAIVCDDCYVEISRTMGGTPS